MSWYYFWEIAVTGVFDKLLVCFFIAAFYFLNKYDRYRMWQKYRDK